MPVEPHVIRSRTIREAILRLLRAAHEGNPDVGVPHGQVLAGFSTGRVAYTPQEIQSRLIDLMDDGLIAQRAADEAGPLPDKLYTITSRGRDFVAARFPWQHIDEYTGGQGARGS